MVLAIVLVLVLLAAYWWFHPPINIHSVDTWTFVAVFVLLPLFLFFTAKSRAYKSGTDKVNASPAKAKTFRGLSYVPVAVLVVGVLGAVLSLSIIPGNAERYSNVLKTDTLEFAQYIQ